MSHKHCVFCGEEVPVLRPTSFSTICLAKINTSQMDTSGHRHHAVLIGRQDSYHFPPVPAERAGDAVCPRCGGKKKLEMCDNYSNWTETCPDCDGTGRAK